MSIGMMKDTGLLFESLLNSAEVKKVDFKGSQYRFDNDILKSQFVKDILCMANAPGGDGYILLGVSAQGHERKMVGISTHHDSAVLEELVASVIEEPVHFEYFPLEYKNNTYALLYIPFSSARPHWPKKDFGKLEKHVFYTRRSSRNAEASISEIREMFLSSIRVTDISRLKPKSSPYIADEFAKFDVDQRTQVMYKTLKAIASKIPLKNYSLISREKYGWCISKTFALVSSAGAGAAAEYALFMYPISVRKDDIFWARSSVNRILDTYLDYVSKKDKTKKGGMIVDGDIAYSYDQNKYQMGKRLEPLGKRLKHCLFVHVSYQNIYTRFGGLQWGALSFQNSWNESWGKILKWNSLISDKSSYEFFVPGVTSGIAMMDRLSNLTSWVDKHPL
jgi:hypothetical protein